MAFDDTASGWARPGIGAKVGALALLAVAAASAALADPGNTFEFRAGVVVDPARAAAYLMNPQHGVDAVDLATGALLWRTDRAAMPLLLHQGRLLALIEPVAGERSLRIAVLDVRDVAAPPRLLAIPLPAGVRPTIADTMESTFRVDARVDDDAVVIGWRYTYLRVTGPPRRPGDQEWDRTATGSVRVNLDSGRVEPIDRMPAPPEPDLPPALARLEDAQAIPGGLWRVDGVFVALERATRAGRQRVILKRWDAGTGESLADVTLFDGGLSFRSVSADRRHLLASRRDASGGRAWKWVVFSLATGAKMAELRHAEPGARFFLFGRFLIHETNVTLRQAGGEMAVEPGGLRAVDHETGVEAWSHAIRDTAYRGPYPPGTSP